MAGLFLALALGCDPLAARPAIETNVDTCAWAALPSPGPLAAEAAVAAGPVALAQVRIREARLTYDPGYYTLAELALLCASAQDPADAEATRWMAYVDLQLHRFADAERRLLELGPHWQVQLWLGDARMEQGDLDGADAAYAAALDAHPGLEAYDRAAHLAWLRGDLALALELQRHAVSAATPAEPEVMAWALTHLGLYEARAGLAPNGLGLALTVVPGYRPAELALGRWFLERGDHERASRHLRAAGPTVEAARALREIDPTTSVEAVSQQDRRGYGLWLAATDPARALPLLDAELAQRRDPATVIGRAWVAHLAGAEVDTDAVRAALATGAADPALLLAAAEVLVDPTLAERAGAAPFGLLPSERARAAAFR